MTIGQLIDDMILLAGGLGLFLLGMKMMSESIEKSIDGVGFFELDNPSVRGSIIICLIQLILYTVREILDTREFLAENGNTAEPIELITIIFNYVFLLGLFILAHYVNTKLLQKLNNKYSYGEN